MSVNFTSTTNAVNNITLAMGGLITATNNFTVTLQSSFCAIPAPQWFYQLAKRTRKQQAAEQARCQFCARFSKVVSNMPGYRTPEVDCKRCGKDLGFRGSRKYLYYSQTVNYVR